MFQKCKQCHLQYIGQIIVASSVWSLQKMIKFNKRNFQNLVEGSLKASDFRGLTSWPIMVSISEESTQWCLFLYSFTSSHHRQIYLWHSYPRASLRQYGAYRPENAGTKYTSPVDDTPAAAVSASLISFKIFKLFLSHFNALPATATEPSRAYTVGAFLPILYATVVSKPCVECTRCKQTIQINSTVLHSSQKLKNCSFLVRFNEHNFNT